MKTSISGFTYTVVAAGAVAAKTFIGFDGNTASAGAAPLGVAAFDAVAGEPVAAVRGGSAVVIAGAALSAGAAVEVGAGGKAVAHTTGVIAGYVAPESASLADGDLIEVLF